MAAVQGFELAAVESGKRRVRVFSEPIIHHNDRIGSQPVSHAAANLGAVETIVGPPATTSHVECTREERARMGIPESLVRYSTGIEETSDLIHDLEQALAIF